MSNSIVSQCLDAKNQSDQSKVTTKLDDFDPKECLSLLSKTVCQLSISVFPLCTPAPGGNEDVFPFVLFCRQNCMSLNCDGKEWNSCHQYLQSWGDREDEKTTHVLEKLSQELDHIRQCHDPLHFQSSLITLERKKSTFLFPQWKKEHSALELKALLNFLSCLSLTLQFVHQQ